MNQKKLPNRRKSELIKAVIDGHKIILSTGVYEDGTLGEIFINMDKEGASFRSLLNCFCILFSIALQHGVPLEKLVNQFQGTRFSPYGLVQEDPNIKKCSSIIDYVVRRLAIDFLDLTEMGEVKTPVEP